MLVISEMNLPLESLNLIKTTLICLLDQIYLSHIVSVRSAPSLSTSFIYFGLKERNVIFWFKTDSRIFLIFVNSSCKLRFVQNFYWKQPIRQIDWSRWIRLAYKSKQNCIWFLHLTYRTPFSIKTSACLLIHEWIQIILCTRREEEPINLVELYLRGLVYSTNYSDSKLKKACDNFNI